MEMEMNHFLDFSCNITCPVDRQFNNIISIDNIDDNNVDSIHTTNSTSIKSCK